MTDYKEKHPTIGSERRTGDRVVPIAGRHSARQPDRQRGERGRRHALAAPLRRRQTEESAPGTRRH